MGLRIKQDYRYEGDDWWKWGVWIEGSQDELDKIDHVVYVLHPTFPQPVRTVTDRKSKFRLDTGGWGVFLLHAKVVLNDGTDVKLSHNLELEYPDNTPADPKGV